MNDATKPQPVYDPTKTTCTAVEAAVRLGLTRKRVYTLIHNGTLPVLDIPGEFAVLTEGVEDLVKRSREKKPA